MATRTTGYPFKCSECDAAFRFEANLEAHVAVLHSDDNDNAGAGVAMIQEPLEQCYLLKEVSPNPDYPFRCSVCRAFFSQEAYVKSHYETLHLKNCPQEQFKNATKVQGQFNNAAKVQGQFNNAAKVQEQFNNETKVLGQLKNETKFQGQTKSLKHTKPQPNHVEEVKPRFRCPHCPKTFAHASSRGNHVNHIHKGRGVRCPAAGCHFLAQCPSHLKLHLVKHSAERPFPCDQCPKTFKRAQNLEVHVKLVHPQAQSPQIVSVFSQKLA